MAAFVASVTEMFSGIFTAIIEALSQVGTLVFTISEAGAVTGVAPFGYVLAVLVGVPGAAWLFSKIWSAIRSIKVGK